MTAYPASLRASLAAALDAAEAGLRAAAATRDAARAALAALDAPAAAVAAVAPAAAAPAAAAPRLIEASWRRYAGDDGRSVWGVFVSYADHPVDGQYLPVGAEVRTQRRSGEVGREVVDGAVDEAQGYGVIYAIRKAGSGGRSTPAGGTPAVAAAPAPAAPARNDDDDLF
jgi:hypothetical protein